MNDDEALLQAIVTACIDIGEFLNATEPEFYTDRKAQGAILHRLLVIGEACKRVSNRLRTSHADVAWVESAKLRDRIAHDLFGARLRIIWYVSKYDVPAMQAQIESILNH